MVPALNKPELHAELAIDANLKIVSRNRMRDFSRCRGLPVIIGLHFLIAKATKLGYKSIRFRIQYFYSHFKAPADPEDNLWHHRRLQISNKRPHIRSRLLIIYFVAPSSDEHRPRSRDERPFGRYAVARRGSAGGAHRMMVTEISCKVLLDLIYGCLFDICCLWGRQRSSSLSSRHIHGRK